MGKNFVLFITVQKVSKSIAIFQSYDHKCTGNAVLYGPEDGQGDS